MNQSEFIRTFSHEIRNPLTLINSSLQLLEADCPAVMDCPLWPQIRRDMQDVLRLLNDMTSLNKSSQIAPAVVSISGILAAMEVSVRPIMKEKGIHFTVSPGASLSDTLILADPLKLREAITNLLLNAIDAVSDLKGERNVLLSAASETPACVSFHVRDNGPGIPVEYLATLFDPFVTHKPHGTGLGLGIVRNIARLHGGDVTVNTCTDAANTYTDFCLRLPLKKEPV